MTTEIKPEKAVSVSKIIERMKESLLFSDSPIDNQLMSFHYICDSLNSVEDKQWAEREINGYRNDDENIIPEYRQRVYGVYRIRAKIPIAKIDKLKTITRHVLHTDAPRLIFLKDQGDGANFSIPSDLNKLNKEHELSLKVDDISLWIPQAIIIKVVAAIKLELIKRLGKLEVVLGTILEKNPILLNDFQLNQVRQYDPKKIFVVHGHDENAKNELYMILREKLNLEPIILTDQANQGRTLIEKFENHTLNVGYAFVILTPDDIGCLEDDFIKHGEDFVEAIKELESRARENVLLELGYFVGALGRDRVCCIQRGKIELLPSDLHGLVTIRYSESIRHAYFEIETELKKAGYLQSIV